MATRIDPKYFSTLSRLFSSALFRELADARCNDRIGQIRHVYQKAFGVSEPILLRDFFKNTYLALRRRYPSEYVYKNEIIRQVILQNHRLSETGVFTEFSCHGSKADLIAVNGTTTVYEIKTELDTLVRLRQQLEDYSKAFSQVNVVTCPNNARQVSDLLKNTSFGLLIYNYHDNSFDILKQPKENLEILDSARMFSLFRMGEYKKIIEIEFGFVPDVLNTKMYNECLMMFKKLTKEKQRDWVIKMLHCRQISRCQIAFSNRLPSSLRALAITRPMNRSQCMAIEESLSCTV